MHVSSNRRQCIQINQLKFDRQFVAVVFKRYFSLLITIESFTEW